jgi:di/tricarboxylate transporter
MHSWIVGGLLVTVIGLMASGRVPVEIVAAGVLAVLGVTGTVPVQELFSGFSEPAVFLIISLFVLSEGMARAKVVRWIATKLAMTVGKRPFLLRLAIFPLVGILAMFLNDTGAVAVFLPLMATILSDLGLSPKRFLLPIGFVALLGGSSTLIGSSANVIVSGFLESRHLPPFQMFDFFPVGGGILLIGLVYLVIVVPLSLKQKDEGVPTPSDVSRKFYVDVRLEGNFPDLGDSLSDVPLLSDVVVLPLDGFKKKEEDDRKRSFLRASWSLIRHRREDASGNPDMFFSGRIYQGGVLTPGDRLRLFVSVPQLQRIAERPGVTILSQYGTGLEEARVGGKGGRETWESEFVVVYEAIPSPQSGLFGRPLTAVSHSVGPDVALVGVHRSEPPPSESISRTILAHGDVLLLKGPRSGFDPTRSSGIFLTLNEVERDVFRSEKALTALGILALFVMSSVMHWIPTALSALVGAIGMFVFGIVTVEEARNAIDWRVVLLMGSMFPLGFALERSSFGSFLIHSLQGAGGGLSPEGTLFLVLVTTIIAVQFLSHTLVALLMAPVALSLAQALHASPMPFLMAVSMGAASVFLTPISHPVNAMTWGAGNYRFRDYLAVGSGLIVLVLAWGLWAIPRVWPFHP